jgi:peptide/nickel transport system substrate-binding protein
MEDQPRFTDGPAGVLSGAYTRRRLLRGSLAAGAALGGGALLAACGGSSTGTSQPSGAKPKRGGNLRVAILGGSSSDHLDAHVTVTQPDNIRVMALYNGLVRISPEGRVVHDLADEITPNADATMWTIRLKPGVTFHDGKPLTATDVLYTYSRITDPKSPGNGAVGLKPLDLKRSRAIDATTLELHMHTPYASFLDQIAPLYVYGIVPVGYDPAKPVGTGPFKFKSFTPGQQSVFARNPDYFKSGRPYLDELTIIDTFATDTAAYDALQGGQVDAFGAAALTLGAQAQNSQAIKPLVSKVGQWTPFTMRVDRPPFDDVRVRQAFRFIIDRQQLIDQSLSGFGTVGNDIFAVWDPAYDSSLKRDQDIEQAKSLLKQAGHDGLSVELVTAPFAPGVVEAAQVIAQQAKSAGVTIQPRQVPVGTFYGPEYLSWTFAQDFWTYAPYLSQVSQGSLPTSSYNETHWNNQRYIDLYNQANATVDEAKRIDIVREMQQIDFNEGGYIIAAYNRIVDLLSSRVNGFVPAGTGVPMGNAGWEDAWLS